MQRETHFRVVTLAGFRQQFDQSLDSCRAFSEQAGHDFLAVSDVLRGQPFDQFGHVRGVQRRGRDRDGEGERDEMAFHEHLDIERFRFRLPDATGRDTERRRNDSLLHRR